MERWIPVIFLISAAVAMILARRFAVRRLSAMDRVSYTNGSLSGDGRNSSDIWNESGNKRNFEMNDETLEEDGIEEMFSGLSEDEVSGILDEVLCDE